MLAASVSKMPQLSLCAHPNNVKVLLLKVFVLFPFLTLFFTLQKRLEERAAEIEKKTKEKREKAIQERLK